MVCSGGRQECLLARPVAGGLVSQIFARLTHVSRSSLLRIRTRHPRPGRRADRWAVAPAIRPVGGGRDAGTHHDQLSVSSGCAGRHRDVRLRFPSRWQLPDLHGLTRGWWGYAADPDRNGRLRPGIIARSTPDRLLGLRRLGLAYQHALDHALQWLGTDPLLGPLRPAL